MTKCDLIVIGAGPGGYETAARAAARGLDTVIVERDLPGGTCLNRGCIPTKALCRSAEVAATVREAFDFGVAAAGFTLDYAVACARRDAIVGELRQGVETLLGGVRMIRGEARFTGQRTIQVGEEELTAPRVIIATGSRPAPLRAEGAELAIDSDRLLALDRLPAEIAIVGGGVIGMEFASIFAAFGSKVSVLEFCPEILPPFDREIAKRLRMAMKRRGVDIVTQAAVGAIVKDEAGRLEIRYACKGKDKALTADMVVSAVGRRPVIPDGLDKAGVALTERGFIKVDASMQTSALGVYAIGDVNGLCMLAHAASAQGRVVLGDKVDLGVMPSAVFTVPECSMVGLTEEQCAAQGLDFVTATSTFRANGKAMAMGSTDGLVKVIVGRHDRRILGCHICGPHAADLIEEIAVAMVAGMDSDRFTSVIHGHPTLSETVAAAMEKADEAAGKHD